MSQRSGSSALRSGARCHRGQPNLDAKAREYLAKQIELHRKSLAELQAISPTTSPSAGWKKAKASRLVTEPMKLARPDFERREVVRAEKDETLAEYPIEGALWLKPSSCSSSACARRAAGSP